MTQELNHDYQNDCGANSEIVNEENEIACDCGSVCSPSFSSTSGSSSIKSKIKTFFFYAIILAAIVIAVISIFN